MDAPPSPAVFHVTHWKAGSSWITRILRRCDRQRVVDPRQSEAHLVAQFVEDPIEPHGVYPRLYLTREEFESVALPPDWRRFVVIRDLRDTLISAYFSVKLSHRANPVLDEGRAHLACVGLDEGSMDARPPEGGPQRGDQASWCQAASTRPFRATHPGPRRSARSAATRCELPAVPLGVAPIVRRCPRSRNERRAPPARRTRIGFRKGVAGDWRTTSASAKARF